MIREGLATLEAQPGQERSVVQALQELAQELAFARQFEQAFAVQVDYQRRSDALRQAANQQRIAQAEAAYQADVRQQRIQALEHEQSLQRRYRGLWVLVGVLGLAVAAVVAVSRQALKKAYQTTQAMALQDPLTGLSNRRHLAVQVAQALSKLRRQCQQAARTGRSEAPAMLGGVAFLLVDLDHFKQVNDVHGHSAGDAVLQQAAQVLTQAVRSSDIVVRWGGEEFLVFAHLAAQHEALDLAERICRQFAEQGFAVPHGSTLRLTCSVGLATYPVSSEASVPTAWEAIVSLADQCLYAAKASGRNQWVGVQATGSSLPPPDQLDLQAGLAQGLLCWVHRAGGSVRWPQAEAASAPAPQGTPVRPSGMGGQAA